MARRSNAGFTLIEVMIAVAVLTLMMVIAWGSVVQTMRAKKHFESQQDRYREARAAMQRIVADVGMAYLSANEDRTVQETRTFFIGEGGSDSAALRFSAFAHQRLYSDAAESDQTIISYYTAPSKENRSALDLIRRETKRLSNNNEKYDTLPGEADVLFSNITKFKLQYFEWRDSEWKDTWTTQGVEGSAGRLPDRVKITISFKDGDDKENEKEIVLTTQAKVHMSETLQFYAN